MNVVGASSFGEKFMNASVLAGRAATANARTAAVAPSYYLVEISPAEAIQYKHLVNRVGG
jgi:hypothetical protein